MDVEFAALLPRVCEALADSVKPLTDDTSLEKLLDWFTRFTKAGGSLLEFCPCLLEFISAVIHNTSAHPAVLALALKLAGLIGATEDGFNMLQEFSILVLVFNRQHWQEAGLWEDPSIRIGWIQGLRSLLQHQKALNFLLKTDFLGVLLQLQTDSSIFVASAANQALVHILVFCQPDSSAGYNGVDKKEEDDRLAPVSLDIVETSAECAAVITQITDYLRESLVPHESSKLHQSLQSLKLLALFLHQVRPPLRQKLLRTFRPSLETLVQAGYSHLTLPLMDVILAAHSSSDCAEPNPQFCRLLSAMLNVNQPFDLIHAAAACLRRGLIDTVHTARAVKILLLPLDIITGQGLLDMHTSDQLRLSVVEQLQSKTSCISLLCTSLTNTQQITLTPPDLLPCPPLLIVTAVLSLLRICRGHISSPSSTSCREVFRNIIGSGKVQKCALETLTALSDSPGAKEKMNEAFTVLIEYLNHPDCDAIVLHKSYQAVVKWVGVCTNSSCVTDELKQDLIAVVKKRACDMRWEVRDSTVEFVGKLASVCFPAKSPEWVCGASEALLGCCSTPLLAEALKDSESYVRASAISALAQTLAPGWQQGAALTCEQIDLVSLLLEILSKDMEGFARRAAVQYFITWLSSWPSLTPPSSSLLMKSVPSVLSQGSADLDWEVKVLTLELAELLLDEALKGHRPNQTHPYAVVPHQARTQRSHTLGQNHAGADSAEKTRSAESDLSVTLHSLVEQGVIAALLSGLVDCDRPVGLKACRLLITLRDTVCALDTPVAMAAVTTVSCELHACGWGLEIRRILDMQKRDCHMERMEGLDGPGQVDPEEDGCVHIGICELLQTLALDERLAVLTQSSDHVHNSAVSLLQDILTASVAHTHPDTQPGQGVVVDCY